LLFSVASYNVLAGAYIQRAWYPRTPATVLNPAWRVPALAQHVANLSADIFCLQEVEPETFATLRASLGERGYGAQYARQRAGRSDGLAIFYRRRLFELVSARVFAYADGLGVAPNTGCVALVVLLQHADGALGVIDTHLTWDPPGTPRQAQRGLHQARELLAEFKSAAAHARGWIIAGDFNAIPDSEIVSLIEDAGLRYAHAGLADVSTCNVNAQARMIDYLFYSSTLSARPAMPERIDGQTVLPSPEQPSDHLALLSRFTWVS
jgi:mRNA deadenylase 3'-5' endonuclease subunit Ccr4